MSDIHGLSQVRLPLALVLPYCGPVGADEDKKLVKFGWMLCDGREISRKKYRQLFDVIGSVHGGGDGHKTFNIPDYRGRFLRGVDHGTGRDPDSADRAAAHNGGWNGDRVGSVQDDEFASHSHTYSAAHRMSRTDGYTHHSRVDEAPRPHQTSHVGGSETRPKNVNVNYIVFVGLPVPARK